MEDGEGGGGGGGDSPPRSGKVYVRAEGKKKNIILSDSIKCHSITLHKKMIYLREVRRHITNSHHIYQLSQISNLAHLISFFSPPLSAGAEDGKDEWVDMGLEGEGEGEGESSDEDEQMGFVHKQPLVATGMAATLALLKGSGERDEKEERGGVARHRLCSVYMISPP